MLKTYVCTYCNESVQRQHNKVDHHLAKGQNFYCSRKCMGLNKTKNGTFTVQCGQCQTAVTKLKRDLKRTKSGRLFCSKSCAALYNNANKKHGSRRSKLEYWIEENLTSLYPKLEIHFNSKEVINSELDIYIPSLKLAFELNGIFHYEPIYGEDKLSQIQNNDSRKFQACLEHGIELCIIDTLSQKRFTEKSSKKFLDIITSIIDGKL